MNIKREISRRFVYMLLVIQGEFYFTAQAVPFIPFGRNEQPYTADTSLSLPIFVTCDPQATPRIIILLNVTAPQSNRSHRHSSGFRWQRCWCDGKGILRARKPTF